MVVDLQAKATNKDLSYYPTKVPVKDGSTYPTPSIPPPPSTTQLA